MDAWLEVAEAIRGIGRKLVGTDGGLYLTTQDVVAVPSGAVEGALHELCHLVVASEEQLRQTNLGLSLDWTHPEWRGMVLSEELAWSLEHFILGDCPAEDVRRMMTPEARCSGGGAFVSETYSPNVFTYWAPLEPNAEAELATARELILCGDSRRPDGCEKLRRAALVAAEQHSLPVRKLQRAVRDWAQSLGASTG